MQISSLWNRGVAMCRSLATFLRYSHRSFFSSARLGILALLCSWQSLPAGAIPPAAEAAASRQKLATDVSSVSGVALRQELLESTNIENATSELSLWYAGKIKQEGQWLSLQDAQQQASADKRLAEYRQRRNQSLDHPVHHEKLARWCKKQNLNDQARVHWMHVLRFSPNHRVALSELGLQWYAGKLLAQHEIGNFKELEKQRSKKAKRWKPKAKRLRQAIEHGDARQRLAARKELKQVRDPEAVPALLDEFAEVAPTESQTVDRQTELMSVLGSINDSAAINNLLTFAVRSQKEQVRYAAINELKSKPLHEFVPTLLAEMKLPVEASVRIYSVGNQVVTNYSYGQEGPGENEYEHNYRSAYTIPRNKYNRSAAYRTRQINVPRRQTRAARSMPAVRHEAYQCGRLVPAHTHPAYEVPARFSEARTDYRREYVGDFYSPNPEYDSQRRKAISKSQSDATGVKRRVEVFNQAAERQNERIAEVLSEVTGETLDAFPKSWWNWWSDYLDLHPDLANSGARLQLNQSLMNKEPRGLSRGTWIWTLEGLRPVENVLPGDYLLSQHPQTGELAYQVVLAIAAPQELEVRKLSFDENSIHCTPGHVLWRAGTGWRRVSKLLPNDSLHSVKESPRLIQSSEAFSIDCYDLIVDGFHTFFVGESGILVHDATPIQPTYLALPGFSPATVARATRLAAVTQSNRNPADP